MGIGKQILGIGIDQIGAELQQGRTKRLMAEQVGNQKELNEHSQQLNKEMWDYTNYENQVKHMENAGLNVGLMYGSSGGSGGTTGNAGGSAASGQAPENKSVQAMGIGLQAEALESQIELNKANANKANTEAGLVKEKTTTEKDSRDIMIEKMKQEGLSTWYENILTNAKRDGWDTDEEQSVITNKIFGKTVGGYREESPEVLKFQAELFKTEAEKLNLDANALLTSEKAKGYWTELLIASKNANSNEIQAVAQKLSAEWNTGEFTNWKTWADLGLKAVQTGASLFKTGTKINSTNTTTQYGDKNIQLPNK